LFVIAWSITVFAFLEGVFQEVWF